MAGISFLLRCRNEEATLQQSLDSLKPLTIDHEIILVLHRCTDRSADIAADAADKNPNIKIFTYEIEVSRAGYETLATDSGSPHSLMTYYNWCKAKATKPWIFKWDADFIASPAMIAYLNGRSWVPEPPTRIVIYAKDASKKFYEPLLSMGLQGYGKYIFWEVPIFTYGSPQTTLDSSIHLEHTSKMEKIKSYWTARVPWFETEQSEEAATVRDRMARLTADFGPEPVGMARACNPECDPPFLRIKAAKPSYVNFTA